MRLSSGGACLLTHLPTNEIKFAIKQEHLSRRLPVGMQRPLKARNVPPAGVAPLTLERIDPAPGEVPTAHYPTALGFPQKCWPRLAGGRREQEGGGRVRRRRGRRRRRRRRRRMGTKRRRRKGIRERDNEGRVGGVRMRRMRTRRRRRTDNWGRGRGPEGTI